MCRIAGIYSQGNKQLQQDILLMRDAMHRGGPDDCGIYIDDQLPLALGHRRLSLIDLSPLGHQPMQDRAGNIQLVFNGEIYNYQEIKNTLISLGHTFKSKTDSEVIIYSYLQWGVDCFRRFNGMFALAIWDKGEQKIILARDHAGIKPLYYHLAKDKLIFASEIRAFKALDSNWPENPEWKIPFLTFGHLPEPFTTLQNVKPLEKGACVIIQLPSLEYKSHRFNKFTFSNTINNIDDAVAIVKEKLEKAVERHLISDAPIGLFLSGGVDSSLLTLIADKYIGTNLKTLSIVFEDATLNEEPYQQLIVNKTKAKHHSFLVTEKEFSEHLPDILQAMDQPSTDGINSYFICKYAKEYGLTAVLSGLGADELFGGYGSFNRASFAATVNLLPSFIPPLAAKVLPDKYKKLAFLKRKDLIGDYLFYRGLYTTLQTAHILHCTQNDVHQVLDKVQIPDLPKNTHPKNEVSWLETNLYMQNQLLKDTDCMSMWHSLEVRVPFLDRELMETAYSIAPQIKYDSKIGKHLLVKAFDDVLPRAIWERQKQGFTFPFSKWMKNVGISAPDLSLINTLKKYNDNQFHWSKYWASLLEQQKPIIYKNVYSSSIQAITS